MMGDDEAMVFRILFLGGEEGGSFLHNIRHFTATENRRCQSYIISSSAKALNVEVENGERASFFGSFSSSLLSSLLLSSLSR
jgi:hypothetical protein